MTKSSTQKTRNTNRNKANQQLSRQQKRVLRQLIARLSPVRKNSDETAFLFSFISAESLLRRVWAYYRQTEDTPVSLLLPEIKKALKFFHIVVNDQALDKLFGPSNIRHQKSARKLRNGMVHNWQKDDCAEAVLRLCEFQGCVEHLIEQIEQKLRG